MDYNADTFSTRKQLSLDSKYRYEYKGAFYRVFSDKEGDYHMAIEDRPSLLARMKFYQNYISKMKYPIFSRKVGLSDSSLNMFEVMRQVLGLPYEVTMGKRVDGRGVYSLTCQEILQQIHFEENLFNGYSYIDVLSPNILRTNHDSVVGLINTLIANGFYVLNPERIFDTDNLNEDNYYPVFVEESLIPPELLREKETADKLLMDFVDDPLCLTKDDYLNLFKPLDSMSLAEKAKLAFPYDKPHENYTDADFERRLALKRYFIALMKDVMNAFFQKYYQTRGFFGFTVLDHDFEALGLENRMVYQGSHQEMYALSYREFYQENDEIKERFVPKNYCFDKKEKKSIKTAFKAVQAYFHRKPELSYIPSLFLKLMGLPYPALEFVKYFDFKDGNSDAFVALLPFDEYLDYEDYGLFLTILKNNGDQYSYRNWTSAIPFYMKKLTKSGIFISDIYAFPDNPSDDFLFYQEKSNKLLDPFMAGDADSYHQAIDFFEQFIKQTGSVYPLDALRDFLIKDDKDGTLVSVKKYFDYLHKGYSSSEALDEIEIEDPDLPEEAMLNLIDIAFSTKLNSIAESRANRMVPDSFNNLFDALETGELFYDPFLPYPYVHKGRLFIGYSKTPDGPIYYDEQDKEAIENLQGLMPTFDNGDSLPMYPFSAAVFGRELDYEHPMLDDDSSTYDFLGLADEGFTDWLESGHKLKYKENISLLYREDHLKLVASDESLSRMRVFSEGLKRGVFLYGKMNNLRPIYVDEKKLIPEYAYFLEEDFLRILIQNRKDTEVEALKLDDKLASMNKRNFKVTFIDRLRGRVNAIDLQRDESPVANIAYSYGGYLSHSIYKSIYREIFHPKDFHHYIGYYYDDSLKKYVAPGALFSAYSDTPDLGSFCFQEKDFPLFMEALTAVKEEFVHEKNQKRKARYLICSLGLPVIYWKKTYDLLLSKEPLTYEKFHDTLGFSTSVSLHGKTNLVYDNFARLKKATSGAIFASSTLYHEALRQGFYISPNAVLLSPALFNISNLTNDLESKIDFLSVFYAKVSDKPTELVADFFTPSETTFSYLLDPFIHIYSEQSNLSSDFLFLNREALEYAYRKDPLFIVKAINSLQGHQGTALYMSYCSEIFKDFSLKEISPQFTKKQNYAFYALFLLYLEQQALIRIAKRLQQ